MKKIIIIFILLVTSIQAQEKQVETIYVDGVKTITEQYSSNGYDILDVNINGKRVNSIRSKDGITLAGNVTKVVQYGKYASIELSITNNTEESFHFIPKDDFSAFAKGKKKINYWINHEEYDNIVKRRQNGTALLLAVASGAAAGLSSYSTVSTRGRIGNTTFISTTVVSNPWLSYSLARQSAEDITNLVTAQSELRQIAKDNYLKANTLKPGQTILGHIYVPFRGLKGDILSEFKITVNGVEFNFAKKFIR